ncbi:N-acetylglucosamine kinase [Microlunatus antarcticus]|uniref:N-acetylglucosamine kinase-like BadF-type ATPase n=1 Tax=Microlunatus antarcticus TaxID=53388 RepID=A0A7W5JTN6_9ACTN|nr:N-acetylglucosamine kinase-like BadF-type ATPase [Microlunatus antarcticus]
MSVAPAVFLGVDGGGTKTALCLVSADGRLLAERDAPSCYYLGAGQGSGPGLVREVLAAAVPAVCADAGIEVAAVEGAFFGLPGYGEASDDLAEVDAIPGEVLGHHRYRCDNDMVCGWAGSLALAAGVNVVSGTGSMSYGERGDLRARVGGWGELFGDEGSAYWLGIRGLQAWTQMTDGREPVGALHGLLGERLGLDDPLDLVSLVHERWQGDRRTIAGLAPLVVRAAEEGDPAARRIVDDAVAELARLALVAADRLRFPAGAVVPVTGSGGVFGAPLVRAAFADRLRSVGGLVLRPSRFSPAVGAALYAAREVGAPLDPDALARLEASG